MNYFHTDINMSLGEDICAALNSKRYPNSTIIEGGSRAKRMSLAKGIAEALVCRNGDLACGECSDCKKAQQGIHPDIEYYTENEKGIFIADTARDVVNSVSVLPNEADAKVYILEVTGPMSQISQNILIKSLEEPPKYAFFIIVCPSKADLLATVISRSRIFSLGEQENETDGELYAEACKAACSVARAVCSKAEFDILAAAGVFEKNKELLAAALPILSEIFVEAMKIKTAKTDSGVFDGVPALLARKFSVERLDTLSKTSRKLKDDLEFNRNYNLIITRLCTLFRANT